MRIHLTLLIKVITCIVGYSQPHPNMRPSMVAIQVVDLEKSIAWYQNNLAFNMVDKKEFKHQGLRLAIMESGDFRIELVDNDKALNKNEVLGQKNASDMTGFAKITFTLENVNSIYAKLKERGANFAITLRDSNINTGEQFFIVLDCDNNWLQFIGPK